MGAVVMSQTPEKSRAMKRCYDRLCRRYLGSDGVLHLPTAAVLASGHLPEPAQTP
jgi:hypothetical protein